MLWVHAHELESCRVPGAPETESTAAAGRHCGAQRKSTTAARGLLVMRLRPLRFLLEAAGYTVEAFAAATDFLNADHQNIACLPLDHQMPAMTGLELAKHLKLAEVAMPIVLMTGALSSAIAAHAVALGIVRVLEKPMDGDDVLDLVEATMTSPTREASYALRGPVCIAPSSHSASCRDPSACQ